MSKFNKVGVVGLGNMGRGMALSLARAGFAVLGFDRSAEAVQAAAAEGVAIADGLAALGACDAVVLSLPTTAIVEAVLEGEGGLAAQAQTGLLVVDTTSGDPQATRALAARLQAAGLRFIDAPVSGGAAGARKGTLTLFIGGAAQDVQDATPLLAAMGDKRFHIGEVGAGDIGKIVNNLLVASHLLTASEAFRLAEAAGVRTEQLIDAVNAGSGRSGVTLYNYPSRILNNGFDSGFTVQLMRKDVNLALSGRAVSGELRIVGEDGDLCAAREEGLVYFKDGPKFEYHNDPEKTAASYNAEGWSTIGDIGYVDEDGYLFLTDRRSNMIISGGVNIYPQEAENVLLGHPLVADAAVFGVPHPDFGEQVVAVVHLRPGSAPSDEIAEQLSAYCRERLSHIKCPRIVDFSDELPRTETGKLLKRVVRDNYRAALKAHDQQGAASEKFWRLNKSAIGVPN